MHPKAKAYFKKRIMIAGNSSKETHKPCRARHATTLYHTAGFPGKGTRAFAYCTPARARGVSHLPGSMAVEAVSRRRRNEGDLYHPLPARGTRALVGILDVGGFNTRFRIFSVLNVIWRSRPIDAVVEVGVALELAFPKRRCGIPDGLQLCLLSRRRLLGWQVELRMDCSSASCRVGDCWDGR